MKYERLTYKPLADNKKKDLDKNGVKTHELSAVYEKLRVENLQGNHDYRSLLYIRLAELEDKIENGTLVELPCKVGDTAYGIWKDETGEYYISADEVRCISVCEGYFFLYDDGNNVLNNDFDENYVCLFFTKEEAEAKLKELK